MRIKLGIFLALLLAFPAQAQLSKSTITALVASQFPDQTTGAITPAIMRSFFLNLINSYQQYSGVNAQVGTSYTIAASDYGQVVTFNNGSAIAVTLPQATGSFSTFNTFVSNLGSGLVTVTPTVSTINGNSSITIPSNTNLWIVSDGTNYQVIRSLGAGGSNHSVAINTSGALNWKVISDCQDTTGNHINYTQSTDVWSCGVSLPAGVPQNTLLAVIANRTVLNTDCGGTIQLGTGSTGFFTLTLPSVSGFPATCRVDFTNADTGRGKALSGFPNAFNSILWPLQSGSVEIVNGAWAAVHTPGRWLVPSSQTFNINHASGSDASDGLGTGATAFATIQHCVNVIVSQIDGNNFNNICALVAETFTEIVTCSTSPVGSLLITLVGTASTSLATVDTFVWNLSSGGVGLSVIDNCRMNVSGFKFTGASNPFFMLARTAASIDFGNIDFAAASGGFGLHILVQPFGTVTAVSNYWITGNFDTHVNIQGLGTYADAVLTTMPNALTWTTGFYVASHNSYMNVGNATFTGTGSSTGSTGTQCAISYNATMFKGSMTVPGSVAPICNTATSATFGGQIQ